MSSFKATGYTPCPVSVKFVWLAADITNYERAISTKLKYSHWCLSLTYEVFLGCSILKKYNWAIEVIEECSTVIWYFESGRNKPQAQVRNAVTRSGTFPSKCNSAYHAQQTPQNSVNKHWLKTSKLTLSLAKIKFKNGHFLRHWKVRHKLRRSSLRLLLIVSWESSSSSSIICFWLGRLE